MTDEQKQQVRERIGGRVATLRKLKGMTQEQLARHLGVTPQAVSKWEHDQSCPDISILPDLASVLGTSIDELLGKTVEVERKSESKAESKVITDFDWNSETFGRKWSILFALYILTIGVLMLVNKIFHIDMSWWTLVWTLGLFFMGLHGLIRRFSLFCLTLSVAGVGLLLYKYDS